MLRTVVHVPQFLIYTALNVLTSKFLGKLDLDYHRNGLRTF